MQSSRCAILGQAQKLHREGETMKERPIIFSGEMVKAILDGRKIQTRRVIKPQPPTSGWNPKEHSEEPGYWIGYSENGKLRNDVGGLKNDCGWKCPYGQVGDRLWVRETWSDEGCACYEPCNCPFFWFKADIPPHTLEDEQPKWRPSIHMPRWTSRITLEITGVRVERVQDIDEIVATHEGIEKHLGIHARHDFSILWDSINGKRGYGWDKNPWVWVIEFRKI